MANERRAAAALIGLNRSRFRTARRWLNYLVVALAATTVLPAAAGAQAPAPPEVGGAWQSLPPVPSGFNAAHLVAGPGGKVLLIAGSGLSQADFKAGTFRSYIWQPGASTEWRAVPTPVDMFCSGHVLLPDGRALVVGGTASYNPFTGAKHLYAFNFATERYEALAPLEVGRWYPMAVTMQDGRTVIASGVDETGTRTDIAEVFDYRTNTHTRLPGTRAFPVYPEMHLAATGELFYSGAAFGPTGTPDPGFWNPFKNTYRPVPHVTWPNKRRYATSCFVGDARNQVLMVMGGGPAPATNTTSVIDLDAGTPAYKAGPPLAEPKMYANCVNLPDGGLLEAGGGTGNSIAQASHEVALLRSSAGPWKQLNPLPAGEHRLYHSLLCVLDSGQVLSVTSNPDNQPKSTSMLVYSPPYLFKGTRPTITSAPTEVTWGGGYPVTTTAEDGATVSKVAISTYPSVTHGTDPNQRYLSIPIKSGTITLPSKRTVMPRGWYRLWAIDSKGRPSVAWPIHVS